MEHAKSNLYFNSATVELWFRGLIYQPRRLWRGSAARVLCFALCMSSRIPSCGCPWLLDKWIYEDKTLLEEDSAFSVDPEGILKAAFPSIAEMSTLRSRLRFLASLQGKAVDLKTVFSSVLNMSCASPCFPAAALPAQDRYLRRGGSRLVQLWVNCSNDDTSSLVMPGLIGQQIRLRRSPVLLTGEWGEKHVPTLGFEDEQFNGVLNSQLWPFMSAGCPPGDRVCTHFDE